MGPHRFHRSFAAACAVLFTACAAAAPPAPAQPKRLVILCVDGLKAGTLQDAEKLGLRIPNLKEFRDRGATSEGLTGVFPTVTYPSHTTIVTGQLPAEHGITGNTLFDPERKLGGAWFWYSELIKVPTLWDAAKAAGLTTASAFWPVTVGARIDCNMPEYREPRNLANTLDMRGAATPGLIRDYEKANGPLRFSGQHHDHVIAQVAAYLLSSRKPHLLLVHLIDLDHDQHSYGPDSPEALRTLEAIDEAIGRIRKAADTAGIAATTRWILLSDHGFYPIANEFHSDAMLAELGLAARPGDPSSWRVATMRNAGSVSFLVKDPNDREAQTLVEKRLRQLQAEGRSGIGRILNRKELAAIHAYPEAFLAVSMAKGWTVGGAIDGPLTTPCRSRGTHGFLPGPGELDCAFAAYGPGIQPRRLPHGQLIDVARTAAALLGISMPSAGGRDLLAPTGR